MYWNGALRFKVSSQSQDTVSPSAPSNLRAISIASNTVTLSCNASSDNTGVAGYKVYRNGVQVATATNTNYKDTGLLPSTVYTYTVWAFDRSGNDSQPSNAISLRTSSYKSFIR